MVSRYCLATLLAVATISSAQKTEYYALDSKRDLVALPTYSPVAQPLTTSMDVIEPTSIQTRQAFQGLGIRGAAAETATTYVVEAAISTGISSVTLTIVPATTDRAAARVTSNQLTVSIPVHTVTTVHTTTVMHTVTVERTVEHPVYVVTEPAKTTTKYITDKPTARTGPYLVSTSTTSAVTLQVTPGAVPTHPVANAAARGPQPPGLFKMFSFVAPAPRKRTAIPVLNNVSVPVPEFVCANPHNLAEAHRIVQGIDHVDGLDVNIEIPACTPTVSGTTCMWKQPGPNDPSDTFGCMTRRISCAYNVAIQVSNCDRTEAKVISPSFIAGKAREILSNCCMGHPGSDKCNKGANWRRSGGVWKSPDSELYIDVRHTGSRGNEC